MTIDTPIKLDRFYNLTIDQSRNIMQVAIAGTGTGLLGLPMKMRVFFANSNWDNDIHSFRVADAGNKGGAVLLYRRDINNPNQPGGQVAYAIKFTNSPQRLLFAEYVLKQHPGVKIPKSLIVELPWQPNVSPDADKILAIIGNRAYIHPSVQHDASHTQKFVDLNTYLTSKKPEYVTIMKGFSGEQLTSGSSLRAIIKQWLMAKGYAAESIDGLSWTTLPTQLRTDPEYQTLVDKVITNRKLLGDTARMKKIGSITVADILLGNGDRFLPTWNMGNSFYITDPRSKSRKLPDPIAVIDNDTFCPVFSKGNLHPEIAERSEATDEEKYLGFVLGSGNELDAVDPNAVVIFPRLRLIANNFQDQSPGQRAFDFFRAEKSLLLQELYEQDTGPFLGLPKLTGLRSDSVWTALAHAFEQGFAEGVTLIQNESLDKYRDIYAELVNQYGIDNNFDFTAFEVRYHFLKEIKVDSVTHTVLMPNYDETVMKIKKEYLLGQGNIVQIIRDALAFGVTKNLISSDEADPLGSPRILALVASLTADQQHRLIPEVTGVNLPEYDDRVKAVQAAVLKYFAITVDSYGPKLSWLSDILFAHNVVVEFTNNLEKAKFYKETRGVLKIKNKSATSWLNALCDLAKVSLKPYYSKLDVR